MTTFFFIILLNLTDLIEASAPLLLIKMPTRERKEQFFKTLDSYYSNLSFKIPYLFVINCDIDDHSMNNPEVISLLENYPNLVVYFDKNKSKIEACNARIKNLDFDIVILASDDMIPVSKNFDLVIVEAFKKFYPDFDGILHFDDGYAKDNLDTLPILGKKYFDRFGYIYFPGYRSLWCDTEMTFVARMLNKITYIDKIIIKHHHYSLKQLDPYGDYFELDSLYINNNKYFFRDKLLFIYRQNRNFNLSSQQIICPIEPNKFIH